MLRIRIRVAKIALRGKELVRPVAGTCFCLSARKNDNVREIATAVPVAGVLAAGTFYLIDL